MQRAAILARFCAKAGFFPPDEADNIHRQFSSSPEASRLTFESWAVSKGFLSVVQARNVVEMFAKSRFLCLGCGKDLFGRDFKSVGNNLHCPSCDSVEFRIQGAAGTSNPGKPANSTSKAPRAPRAPRMDEVSHPDEFEEDAPPPPPASAMPADGFAPADDFDAMNDFGPSDFGPSDFGPSDFDAPPAPPPPPVEFPARPGTEQWAMDFGADVLGGPNEFSIGATVSSPLPPMPNGLPPIAPPPAPSNFGLAPPPPPPMPMSAPPMPDDIYDRAASAASSSSHMMMPSSSGGSGGDTIVSPQQLDRGLPEGSVLEGIKILKTVGRGGNGIVYKGIQQKLDRTVALKILNGTVLEDDVQNSRFQLEARAAAQLEHPNIVQVYTFGEKFGRPFLVMQWIDGESLGQMIDSVGPLPILKVLDFAIQACQGLHEAHRHNIIHRDVKPDNLIINSSGLLKIVDFGLAKQTTNDILLSDPRFVLGTPAYIAPEQALGQPIDARTDIYSLGITLYHALTGEIPFDGPAGAVVHKHIQAPLPSPRSKRPDLSRELDQLIQQMCAKVPNQRPRDMNEVAEKLRAIQQTLTGQSTGQGKRAPVTNDIVDQVFDGSHTRIYISSDNQPVSTEGAVNFDDLDEIMGTKSVPMESPLRQSSEFKPIEEIEFVSGPVPADAPPEALPATPTPKPTTGSTPAPSAASASAVPAAAEAPAPTMGGRSAGMKGRSAADTTPRAAASSASSAPTSAPPDEDTSIGDVQQILGKDYTAKLSAIVPEIDTRGRRTPGTRGKPVLLLGFLGVLMIGGLVGLLGFFISQDSPSEKRMKELIVRSKTEGITRAPELREEMRQFAADHASLTDSSTEFQEALKRMDVLVEAHQQDQQNVLARSYIDGLNAMRAKVRMAVVQIERFASVDAITRVEEVERLRNELARAEADAIRYIGSSREFQRQAKFPVGDPFVEALSAAEAVVESSSEMLTAVKLAIDVRQEQDRLRLSIVNDARTILGGIYNAHPDDVSQLPGTLERARANELFDRLEELLRAVGRFTDDAELRRILMLLQRVRELQGILDSVESFVNELETKKPEDQLRAIRTKAITAPDIANADPILRIKAAAEARIVELRETARELVAASARLTTPRDADAARALKGRIDDFLPTAAEADADGLRRLNTRLTALIDTDDANRREWSALSAEVDAVPSVAAAQDLRTRIDAFGRRVPYLDVAPLRTRLSSRITFFEQESARQAKVGALLDKLPNARTRDQAAALLTEFEALLQQPDFAGFAETVAPVRAELEWRVEWLTLGPPPRSNGFPWQARRLAEPTSPLKLQRVIGHYLPPGHVGPLHTVNFSADGELMVTADKRTAKIWKLDDPPVEWRSFGPFESDVATAHMVGDNRLAVAVGGEVRLFDAATRQQTGTFGGHFGPIFDFAVSPDFVWLVTAGRDGKANVFKIDEPGQIKQSIHDHVGQIPAVAFAPATPTTWANASPQDRRLVTAGRDGKVRLWRLMGEQFASFGVISLEAAARDVAASHDGSFIVSGDEVGNTRVWNTLNQREPAGFRTVEKLTPSIAAVAVGQTQVLAASTAGVVHVFDLFTGNPLLPPLNAGDGVACVAFSPDNRYILAGTESGRLVRWDIVNNGRRVPGYDSGHTGPVVAASNSANLLAGQDPGVFTVSRDGSAAVWNLNTGQLLRHMVAPGETLPAIIGGGACDATTGAVVAADGRVWTFNLRTGRLARTFESNITTVAEAADAVVAADGRLLIADGRSGRIVIFDALRGVVRGRLEVAGVRGYTTITVSRDSTQAAAGTADGATFIWTIAAPNNPRRCERVHGRVRSLAFSADGAWLVVGGGTDSASECHIFDAAQGGESLDLIGSAVTSPITAVAVDSAGRTILAYQSGSVAVYARSGDGPAELVDTVDLAESGDFIRAFSTAADGRLLASTARGVVLVFEKP